MDNFNKLNTTNELKFVVSYMTQILTKEFRTNTMFVEIYIIGLLEVTHCWGRKVLENIMLSETMKMLGDWCARNLSAAKHDDVDTGNIHFEPLFDACFAELKKDGKKVDTCTLLLSLIKHSKTLEEEFNKLGITIEQIEESMSPDMEDFKSDHIDNEVSITETKQPVEEKKEVKQKTQDTKQGTQKPKVQIQNNDVERNLININKMAAEGRVDEIIGNHDVYTKIFTTFKKKDKNNICIVGESGCGKTDTVKYIASLINQKKVPEYFLDKQLVMFDFVSLTANTGFRGGFEAKYKAIIDAATRSKKYIFFIDDIHSILQPNSKFTEMSTDVMLEYILNNNEIGFICTTTYEGYSKYIEQNKTLSRRMEKIELVEDKARLPEIIRRISEKYEIFHNVNIAQDVIDKAISLSERYLGSSNIDKVCDVLDTACAISGISMERDEKLAKMEEELENIQSMLLAFTEEEDYDQYDKYVEKELKMKSDIAIYKKKLNIKKLPKVLDMEYVYKAVSMKAGVNVGILSSDERTQLKKLSDNIKKEVIGQDQAVDTVCRAVRRQRVGIGNPSKPPVLALLGSSGVGKTMLAKKLAKNLFGSENNMVRLDMSEYSDKISSSKLTGSSPGYIGYDDGGILTEAIKKKPHCVLLLDEIEKADEEVFNTFLQVFDEGRLTDNKGVTVSFKNVIILMTSNLGSQDLADGGHTIGFGSHDAPEARRDIVMKAMKKAMKPEFINRIDEIVLFNKLTDDNLRNIIQLEVAKVEKRVNKMGYKLSKDITQGKLIDNIFQEVIKEREYGARPVLREIQRQLEDKLTDYIIDKNPKDGYTFKLKDIYKS